MRRIAPWLVAIFALLGLTAAWYGYWQRGLQIALLRAQMDDATHRTSERIHDLQIKLADTEKARTAAERIVAANKAAGRAAQAGPNAQGSVMNMDEMRKDPAFAPIWRKQQLRNILRQYGDTFAAMKLPPDELAKLKDLLLARNEAMMDAQEAGREAGLTPRDIATATQQAMGDITNEMRALIGDDGLRQLQSGPQTGMYKSMIENSVAVDLTGAGVPLTPDQEAALATAYGASRRPPDMANARGWQTPDPQSGLAPADQAMLDQAAQYLTPAQLPIVKDYLLEQQQQQQYFRQRAAAQAGGG